MSKEDSLVRAAYDELRQGSASTEMDGAELSWCRRLECVLEELNLHRLWKSNSADYSLQCKHLFLLSLKTRCRTLDLEHIKNSSFISHYFSIIPAKNLSSAPYLNFKLRLYTVRRIAQIRLNLNTIFYEGRTIGLGMWEEKYCKFCGYQPSLSHALHECANNVKLRQQLAFPCSDQLGYLRFPSDLGHKNKLLHNISLSTCLFKKHFRIICKLS